MTTVAHDGRYLSADRQLSGSYKFAAGKIHRIKGNRLVACAGRVADAQAFIRWLDDGAHVTNWPDMEDFEALVAYPGGKVEFWGDGPMSLDVTGQKIAIGSGGPIAMGVMLCGKTAEKAVEIASQLDDATGMGIDTIDLTKMERKPLRR